MKIIGFILSVTITLVAFQLGTPFHHANKAFCSLKLNNYGKTKNLPNVNRFLSKPVYMSSNNQPSIIGPNIEITKPNIHPFISNAIKVVFAFGLQIALMVLFKRVAPSFAKEITKKVAEPTMLPLWKRVLEGINSKSLKKNWKAGDSRQDYAGVINMISSMAIFVSLAVLGTVAFSFRGIKENLAYNRELKRVDEYKEVNFN